MQKCIILIALLNLSLLLYGQTENYQRVLIYTDEKGLTVLGSLGIPLDEGIHRPGISFITELSESQLASVRQAGFATDILIEDVKKYYRDRNQAMPQDSSGLRKVLKNNALDLTWPVPDGFSLGSMGGFCTIEEMKSQLDSMAVHFPNLITSRQPTTSTLTHEGREIYWVKISDNPNLDEPEPEILYTGLHHAREPIGMQQLLFYMYYLLENYATDSLVQYIVNNTELYFVPMINPDGYAYNEANDPQGGGLWRKNRSDNGGGNYGVDLNRNYGFMWGFDDLGSSPMPGAETFRGYSAFSEPETQNIRDFCNSHEFELTLNYHSFGNYLLYPWGFTADSMTSSESIFNTIGQQLIKENEFLLGPLSTSLYIANGGSDDWMYGEHLSKPQIISYTPEVGSNSQDFWPVWEDIIPLCQVCMYQNISLALCANPFAVAKDRNPYFITSTQEYLKFDIQSIGLAGNTSFTVSIQGLGNDFANIGSPKVFNGMTLLESRTDSISFQLIPGVQVGQKIKYLIKVSNGLISTSDTLTKVYGDPVTLFEEEGNNLSAWNGSWAITTSQYFSPPSCITDSPGGPYSSLAISSVSTTASVDLSSAVAAIMEFSARWEIEKDFDFVQVKGSKNGGLSWSPLNSLYTHVASPYQPSGEPVYDGNQLVWVSDRVDLSDYLGYPINIRFTIESDSYAEFDGFYFDDLRVKALFASGMDENKANSSFLSSPFPNPSAEFVLFTYRIGKEQAKLEVLDIQGRLVASYPLEQTDNKLELDVAGWNPGVYIYRIKGSGSFSRNGKFVVLP